MQEQLSGAGSGLKSMGRHSQDSGKCPGEGALVELCCQWAFISSCAFMKSFVWKIS